MSRWRSGDKSGNLQDDQRRLLYSGNDDPSTNNGDLGMPTQPATNPTPTFPSSNYSDPSQPGHYSSPADWSAAPQSPHPVSTVGNVPVNPPQYKASDPNAQTVVNPPGPTQMAVQLPAIVPSYTINVTYPIIQKLTSCNQVEAMSSQIMACPFCHKSIKTGFRYVPGDSTYFMAAICCILLGLIGLLLALCCDTFQDIEHFCPNCSSVIKKYTR